LNREEQRIQMQFVKLFRLKYKNIILTCAPGNAKNAHTGVINKKMGYLRGYPDISILYPSKGYNGLLIEFKTPKGKICKKFQEPLLEKLNNLGYKAVICRSVDEALEVCKRYIKS